VNKIAQKLVASAGIRVDVAGCGVNEEWLCFFPAPLRWKERLRCGHESTPEAIADRISAVVCDGRWAAGRNPDRLGGVPLVVQAFRSLGVPASVRQHVRTKQSERGHDEATMVEGFVVLTCGIPVVRTLCSVT
jgi:hypothetical protein